MSRVPLTPRVPDRSVHGPGQEPREVYGVKVDVDSLAGQKHNAGCADPASPVEAGGCCP